MTDKKRVCLDAEMRYTCLIMGTVNTTQLCKLGQVLRSLKQSARALASEKPLISLRGLVKGARFSEKQIKASRRSLFETHI